jgi:hypothetical protein
VTVTTPVATPLEPVEVSVLAVDVLDAEVETRTVVLSSGESRVLAVATGRMVVRWDALTAAVKAELAETGLRVNGALQVLDADPATQAWLTVRVPVALAGA